jgi:hypothetical protein
VVTLTICNGHLSISEAWGKVKVCTLPWKPDYQVYFAVILQEGLSGVIGIIELDGSVYIQGKDTQWRKGWLFGAASYVSA